MNEEILDLFQEIINLEDIELSDIPQLDLYMDQVITLFENKLEKGKRSNKDKLLTKTMINNYVKDKLLMPAESKRYTPEHLIMMALIYNLKQILSISDIKQLFTKTIYKEDIDLFMLYSNFIEAKKEDQLETKKELELKLKNLNQGNSDAKDLLMVILSLVSSANMYKQLAEKLIDYYLIDSSNN